MRKLAMLLLTVAFVWSSVAVVLRAEESSEKENGDLAEALESVKVSLDDGLQANERKEHRSQESLRWKMASCSSPSTR